MPLAATLEDARQIDQYTATHVAVLEERLSASVDQCMTERPGNPLQFIGIHLLRGLPHEAAVSAAGPGADPQWPAAAAMNSGGAGFGMSSQSWTPGPVISPSMVQGYPIQCEGRCISSVNGQRSEMDTPVSRKR